MTKRAIGAGSLFPDTAKSIFIRITGQRFDSMAVRVKRKGFPGLPFDKKAFRGRILSIIGGCYDGFVRCPYCTGFFTLAQTAIDHSVPLGRGGGVELENLDLPCKPCNARKGNLRPEEYLRLLQFLDREIPLGKQDVLNRLEISVQLVTGARADAPIKKELKQSGAWQAARRANPQKRWR
jgi:hypothetical protein